MNISDFLGITVVGAVLSVLFQQFKTTSGNASKYWMIGLSVVVGGVYMWIRETIWYETILGVLAASSTVYSLFLKPTTPTPPAE